LQCLARLDQALGFAQRRGLDENYALFFRGRFEEIEEFWRHGADSIIGPEALDDIAGEEDDCSSPLVLLAFTED
jgi:hypothetical protein